MTQITPPATGVSGVAGILQNSGLSPVQESESSFADVLSGALDQYNQVDNGSDMATLDLLSGNTDNLSDTLIATEKAEIALNLTVAVRNKAMDAYKEIMNMQI
jgi:flagellar hook-basal body complex protein FliE